MDPVTSPLAVFHRAVCRRHMGQFWDVDKWAFRSCEDKSTGNKLWCNWKCHNTATATWCKLKMRLSATIAMVVTFLSLQKIPKYMDISKICWWSSFKVLKDNRHLVSNPYKEVENCSGDSFASVGSQSGGWSRWLWPTTHSWGQLHLVWGAATHSSRGHL